uniref:phosphoenolpyruvate carboxykinase (ATP) n=1 Tax=Chromera velia CCMP2878 TaxID=1169474 RepID=A0A0G4HYF6_9ALVE|mmetsp:Transcript_50195/g.98832  ORF Transcript_50195/g.98832 Transcript_50195/m.98832 type:complete len:598 (+) Transcript_50195:118-1911(+)|eukprot:Cvel_9483.t1-p1 / transcript=Cvel_9483.t1 / gene=Cvel_9483 / organism=Chromera_velia_CCMP2878 / gene_product=Phosphoenolpyruvate carboxykinase [ATP], putative / transcript_product=Phosphoenolpyruvate carboxykinase [ATP], putative / location=Cvel_scaffold547:67823-72507(+) / protein_length=597 / sequence_SO=supercontig / SO=protein_coding / is_pseudo=false
MERKNSFKVRASPKAKAVLSGKKTEGAVQFLEMLKKQIDMNLAHAKPGECMMTRREMFAFSQFENEQAFEWAIQSHGITVKQLFHNAPAGELYEEAIKNEAGSYISAAGALMVSSGQKTGRSPQDKRIVDEPTSRDDVWWGKVNMKLDEDSFMANRERAIDFLNTQERLFVVDAFAGWDPEYRVRVRVITSRAYHALFMQNMLVMPTEEEMADFHPDFIIYNAGCFPANRYIKGITSQTSVMLHFGRGEMVILGTQYAGEMKKGIFTVMMHLMPRMGHLPLHSSCNVGDKGDVSLFFGLSGTGKTTLSADPHRHLIGDDEHVWTDKGIFNIEGGCYAKCVNLSREKEPEIYDAIRFGAVLENVVFDAYDREPDYEDTAVTENTRASYPLKFIPNALIPAKVDDHPTNIILLTCDAFGVLPPISKLTPEQVMYHFVSGYTAKVAGTEQGITEPSATFSACFGAPFLVRHPMVYAEMLATKLKDHRGNAWLINTGWVGGAHGKTGKRIPLKYTRLMIDAIHSGAAAKCEYETMPVFGLHVPKHLEGVPDSLLMPSRAWPSQVEYQNALMRLAQLFKENFTQYQDKCPPAVQAVGPAVGG